MIEVLSSIPPPILAQEQAPGGGSSFTFFVPMLIGLGVLMFLSIRSKKKEEDEKQKTLDGVKKGDRIVTIGGLIGRVVEIREKEFVLKVDETNGTRVHIYRRPEFLRAVLKDEKDEAKEKDAKDAKEKDAKPAA